MAWILPTSIAFSVQHHQYRSQSNRLSTPTSFLFAESISDKMSPELKDNNLRSPFGDMQEYALRDNIQKYLINIPSLKDREVTAFCLWRSMARDVIELAGYDAAQIRDMYNKYIVNSKDNTNTTAYSDYDDQWSTLPLLDHFEFQTNGGVSGSIHDLPGLQDGTRIQTSPLKNVQLTVPRGYVMTEDGTMAYELGVPLSKENYDLNIAKYATGESIGKAASTLVDITEDATKVLSTRDAETDFMLRNIGASTAIVLGGAAAMNLLSHHLTVNVFWV